MKNLCLIQYLVGALLCALTIVACSDDSFEGVSVPTEEPEASEQEDVVDNSYSSWFDQNEEDRWGIRWLLGDDMTFRGPGEYEFDVPAGGDEFTFWFPDCNSILKWAEFDGVIQYNDIIYNLKPYDIVCNDVVYEVADDNCLRINIKPNAYNENRRFAFSINSKDGRGTVRFVFNQSAGDGSADPSSQSQYLYWKSEEQSMFFFPTFPANNYIRIFPESTGDDFVIKCMNADDIKIYKFRSPDQSDEEVVDSYALDYDGFSVNIQDCYVRFKLSPNNSGANKVYRLSITDGTRVADFYINHRFVGHPDQKKVYPADPEWELVNDGTRWTGGITNDGVFKVRGEGGDTLTIRTTNYYFIRCAYIQINRTYYEKSSDALYTGGFDFFDIPIGKNSAGVYHQGIDAIDVVFSPNTDDCERVIKVMVSYHWNPKTVGAGHNAVFSSAISGYNQFVFLQAPYPYAHSNK